MSISVFSRYYSRVKLHPWRHAARNEGQKDADYQCLDKFWEINFTLPVSLQFPLPHIVLSVLGDLKYSCIGSKFRCYFAGHCARNLYWPSHGMRDVCARLLHCSVIFFEKKWDFLGLNSGPGIERIGWVLPWVCVLCVACFDFCDALTASPSNCWNYLSPDFCRSKTRLKMKKKNWNGTGGNGTDHFVFCDLSS